MAIPNTACRLRQLPPELAPIILSQAPDSPTLRNLILSAPAYYHGYFSNPRPILEAVLFNEFGPLLLPEALATYASLHLPQAGFDSARDHFLSSLSSVPQIPDDWTLTDSLALSKISSHVDFFASDLTATWFQPSQLAIDIDREPVTRAEMDRTRRTFFRYELYCNLFRKTEDRPEAEGRKERFLDRFSPWENEQLWTVYEYMWHRMSTAFNDVAEHDVLWGKHRIRSLLDETQLQNAFKEHHLSLGLAWLHKLALAETYDERYRLLIPETGEQDPQFLYMTFQAAGELDPERLDLEELTEDTILDHVKSSFVADPDRGPFKAWWWAHRGFDACTTADIFCLPELTPLRKTGYVFFDDARLQRRHLLDRNPEQLVGHFKEDEDEKRRRHEYLERSQRERTAIYDAGGRGYWSEDCNSRLIWSAPYLGPGIEWSLEGRKFQDYWRDGILLDRVRIDAYNLRWY